MPKVMMKLLSKTAITFIAVLAAFQGRSVLGEGMASLESWPMFRGGPALTGVSPAKLPAKPVLKWSFKAGDPIKSSAAIEDGTVYLGADNGYLYALDLKTGKEKWKQVTDGMIESSPLVLGDYVYVGSGDEIGRASCRERV